MQLRQYQIDSIESLRNGFRDGHTRQVLCAATGGGKSVIMLAMIKAAIEKGSRVMFVCERRILVDQFSRHLTAAHIDHGVLMAGHWRYKPHAQVQVASIQTLERMESWPAVDVIFIDELHAAMRKSIIKMITARPNLRIVGATATPFHPAIGEHFTSMANVITMRELVDDGFLVPFRVFVAHEINTKGLKVTAGEWQKDQLEQRSLQIVGDVVADFVKISDQVFGGVRKTICFSAGVAHGAELVGKFIQAGIRAVQISYRDSDEWKAEILADFSKPDTRIQVVISSDILTRGFDQPDVEHVIVARPLRKSFSTHVQMIGRGARIHAGKEFCVIQDHSGNWLRFADDWHALYGGGAELVSDSDTKTRKEPTEKEKVKARCPVCFALWPAKSDSCTNCGHVRHVRSQVTASPGEIMEIGGGQKQSDKHSSAYKEQFYRELLWYAASKSYKDGWAYHKYKEKFGLAPPWKKIPLPASVETQNWIRHTQIKLARGRK